MSSLFLAAPLQGYTERPFRNAHASAIGGVHEYYAPFARLEKGEIRNRDLKDLTGACNATVPQLLAKTPDELRCLAEAILPLGFTRLDLNLGCPFPKVTDSGYGAALLDNPSALSVLLEAFSAIPAVLSVKMRLPQNPLHLNDLALRLNDIPLIRIVMHPRTASQQYSGNADMLSFQRFSEASKHSVIFNGNITTADEASVNDNRVMVGRGLLANPMLPLEIQGLKLSSEKRRQYFSQFHKALMDNLSETQQPLLKLKPLWDFLLPDSSPKLRKKIIKSKTLDEYSQFVTELIDSFFL